MCRTDGQKKAGMGKELPLCWPGRRGAPRELSSRFPLLSPAPVAPYMGSPFPLNTRPYSNPRGLRLPAASLCTEAPIPRCLRGAPGRCCRAGLCSGMELPPPAHPHSHLPCASVLALCLVPPLPRGMATVGRSAFMGLNLFTSLITPRKLMALQEHYRVASSPLAFP